MPLKTKATVSGLSCLLTKASSLQPLNISYTTSEASSIFQHFNCFPIKRQSHKQCQTVTNGLWSFFRDNLPLLVASGLCSGHYLAAVSSSLLRLSKVMEKILLLIEIDWSSELSAVSFLFWGTLNRETRINLGQQFCVWSQHKRDLECQVVQLSAHLRGAEPHSFQAQPSKWKYKSFGRCLKQKYSVAEGRESAPIAAAHCSIHI